MAELEFAMSKEVTDEAKLVSNGISSDQWWAYKHIVVKQATPLIEERMKQELKAKVARAFQNLKSEQSGNRRASVFVEKKNSPRPQSSIV